MKIILYKLIILLQVIFGGHFKLLFSQLRQRLFSKKNFYFVKRDLDIPFKFQKAKIEFSLRKIIQKDFDELFNKQITHQNDYEFEHYIRRRLLYYSNFHNCYVAVNTDNSPMLIIWVMYSEEQNKIDKVFQYGISPLANDEALIEGVYTLPDFRGEKLMAETIVKLSKIIKKNGKRFVVGYVESGNLPSLKALQNTGFYIDKKIINKWRLLRKSTRHIRDESLSQILNGTN